MTVENYDYRVDSTKKDVVEEDYIKNLKKKHKQSNYAYIAYIAVLSMISCLCFYLLRIGEIEISNQRSTISNTQTQLTSFENIIKRLNPLVTIERYLKEQKIIKETNFIMVIEKLQPKLSPSTSKMIANSLLKECEKKNIDENLILSLIYTESSIDPMKESNMGACGLMQVRYKTWKEEPELKDNGVDKWHKLFWPEENIKAGTDIFKKFYAESGNNINTTLYRYNSGSQKIPPNPSKEVLDYINKIMYYHYYIQNLVRGNNESSKGFNR